MAHIGGGAPDVTRGETHGVRHALGRGDGRRGRVRQGRRRALAAGRRRALPNRSARVQGGGPLRSRMTWDHRRVETSVQCTAADVEWSEDEDALGA
ncbi:hypothetical protein [Streptomyces fructofermentans]|uniref:hypothetical protein n=1 Tax=Streptomyces fructofermentans TaxID=152141 RepID=UPI00379BBB7D